MRDDCIPGSHNQDGIQSLLYWLELYPVLGGLPGGSVLRNLPAMQETQETWVRSLDREYPLEKEMASHFSILVCEIPWTVSLAGCHPQGCKELDMTKATQHIPCFDVITRAKHITIFLQVCERLVLLNASLPYFK